MIAVVGDVMNIVSGAPHPVHGFWQEWAGYDLTWHERQGQSTSEELSASQPHESFDKTPH